MYLYGYKTDRYVTASTYYQFSDYSELYDLIIPQDNLLRRIKDLVDFSFIQKELMDKYCHDNGRMAESPVKMFKYLLLKTIYDISDVDVVERSRYDMSFKYFLGMTPENTDLINPSSLCKFRKLRLKDKDLLNLLIGKTVEIAIEKGIIKSRTIIVDATHTGSRSNPYSPIEILRLRSKQLRKSMYEADDTVRTFSPQRIPMMSWSMSLTTPKRCLMSWAPIRHFPKSPKSENASICSRKCLPT